MVVKSKEPAEACPKKYKIVWETLERARLYLGGNEELQIWLRQILIEANIDWILDYYLKHSHRSNIQASEFQEAFEEEVQRVNRVIDLLQDEDGSIQDTS